MSAEPALKTLLDRLRDDDANASADAAQHIFRLYAQRLIALARSRMTPALQQKVDPEDVMLSVFKSFFARQDLGQFDLDDWDSLWSLLTLITLRKCGYQVRRFRVARREIKREEAIDPWEAIARDATPIEAAVLAETVEGLFRDLKEGETRIVELALQGYKASEISEHLGLAERSVYRFLERLKGKLERLTSER